MKGSMFAILLSALNSSSAFIARSIMAKFFAFFAMFFIVSAFISVLVEYVLPSGGADNLDGLFGSFPSGLWYFLDLFAFPQGFSLVISAYVIRFIVRRVPVVG